MSKVDQLPTTKLNISSHRPDLVSRQCLIEQLNTGVCNKLTLLSSLAGFGKTTLVITWVQQVARSIAWLSLDDEDNNPDRFLVYFISAIQSIIGNLSINPESILLSPQPWLIETTLTTIINCIATILAQFILVLDDIHLIKIPPIHQPLTFQLDHQPPQLHPVVITREDPPLPLSCLRGRGK